METYPINVSRPPPLIPQVILVGVVIAVLAAILLPVFASARAGAREHTCSSNVKEQSLSVLLYIQDWDETFPSSRVWMDTLTPYMNKATDQFSGLDRTGDPFQCPGAVANNSGPLDRVYGYAYNSRLSKLKLEKVEAPVDAVMIFESASVFRNAADAFLSVQVPPRHAGRDNISMLDGHVEPVQLYQFDSIRNTMQKNEPWFKPGEQNMYH